MITPLPCPELKTSEDRRMRATLLADPRFSPLELYSATAVASKGGAPHVDPLDGGTEARCLLLMETPGPRLEPPRFVSRDNATGTARNLRRFLDAAGLARRDTLLWNAVPWLIHAPAARNRAPRRDEIEAGLALLPGFLALLPRLTVVVMAGRVAGLAAPMLRATLPDLAALHMPHPSPTYVNTSPAIPIRIAGTLAAAAEVLAGRRQA